MCHNTDEWENCMVKVRYLLNNTFYKSIQTTSAKLFFGCEQQSYGDNRFDIELNIDTDLMRLKMN